MEQNNYLTKIEIVQNVYDLNAWPRNLTNNFKFKNYLFEATNIVKNSDKENYVYNGYGIKFNSPGPWTFGNDFARNVMIFGVDISSTAHFPKCKNNFVSVRSNSNYGINGGFGLPEKKFNINFT